jgi:hypothetical protein
MIKLMKVKDAQEGNEGVSVGHRWTRLENPEGGSMRFLPNFGREGI